MSDAPLRWSDSDDGPEEVRALLRDARAVPEMTATDRAAIVAGVLSGLGGGPGEGGAAGTGTAATISVTKTIALVASLGALVVAGVGFGLSRRADGVDAPAMGQADAPETSTDIARPAVPSADAPAVGETDDREPAAVAASGAAHAADRPVASNTNAGTVDTLGAESALVEKARPLVDSRPADAIATLEEHTRRFPSGELAPEREYLLVRALRRAGRIEEARRHARAYAGRFPSSPYAPAMRGIVEELGGP
jgi:hypothetical protein